jgi:hypothetical protein
VKTSNLEKESNESLLASYEKAAGAHGRATETGDHVSANAEYEIIVAVYHELRRRGVEAQRLLLSLLKSDDPGVRLWASSHVLDLAPDQAEPVLEAMSHIPKSLVSFSAMMTLSQWREGKLQFP